MVLLLFQVLVTCTCGVTVKRAGRAKMTSVCRNASALEGGKWYRLLVARHIAWL